MEFKHTSVLFGDSMMYLNIKPDGITQTEPSEEEDMLPEFVKGWAKRAP